MNNSPIHQTPDMTAPPVAGSPAIKRQVVVGVIVFVLFLGSLTGFMLAHMTGSSQNSGGASAAVTVEQSDTKAGIIDKKTFSDTATGVLREGGFEGEGSFHLERGAKDQTAYLTSSTADLSMYVGKKVQVWGQTYAGEKTGWLMDVGYIEVVK